MILSFNEFHQKSVAALAAAVERKDISDWNNLIKDASLPFFDGFLILQSYPGTSEWLRGFGFNSINEWLMTAERWHIDALDASNENEPDIIVLITLWMGLKERTQELLRKARLNAEIPNHGGALVYVDGISKCLIMNYAFHDTGNARLSDTSKPVVEILDIIDDPKSVFDFWGIVNQKGMLTKNRLKEILSTGHKIIIHRDTLLHVDRRKDFQVFGPSIDTLLLSEIIAQTIYEGKILNCQSALEVGCGNGLLTVNLAKNCHSLKDIYACDINFEAVNCTNRNIKGVISPTKEKTIQKYLVAGAYNGTMLNRQFDLIVCNPPYIPIPNDNKIDDGVGNFLKAVGGLEVIDELLGTLDRTLARNGRLLLLVSSLSLDYTLKKIPSDYAHELIIKEGFEVPFDVEAVLSQEEWLNFLLNKSGLIKNGDNFSHLLFPMWIYKK